MLRQFSRLNHALVLAAVATAALGLSACGGGEKTVTVTETVATPSSGGGSTSTKPTKIEAKNGAVAGYVDFSKEEGESLILTGWAASAPLTEPADKVVAQVGGETLAEAVPAVKREDVVAALGKPGLLESGFELRLPLDSLDCSAPAAGIKVIGYLGGKSGTLQFAEGIKEAITEAC
jgi:hypothetical protein